MFLETATELTATLVLHPTNVETLATQFWAYQSNLSYSQAAPYAGVMVLIAAVPGYVLGRWFDRQPERAAMAGVPVPAPAPSDAGGGMKDLRISGVAKSFGSQRVLRGLDLSVPHGSFTAILGASGSGKTTLLRIVAGFERPDEGEVRLGEEVVDDAGQRFVPSEHRRIGYVPQEGALFPHLSVGRNVGFGLAARPGPARRGSTSCSSWWACPVTAGATRTSCRAASSSGSRLLVPWRSSPRSCCSTSRLRRSTPRYAPRSGPTCSGCCGVPARRPSW